ncbi:MAG: POTRA domain-containing protein [Candidatus Cloacimonetes bacterium]|nr:POTRA domain-containing protein [Candidatus Cloacimonadota bacterium]
MQRIIPLLLLSFWACFAQAVNIGKISFSGINGVEESALKKASGLELGQEYTPEAISYATQMLYDYFNAQGRYFIQISAPELIPLNSDNLELHFTITEFISSGLVKLKFSGMNYFSEDKLKQLLLLPPEPRISLNQIPRLMQQILAMYHNRSYLFAKVQVDSLVLNPDLTAHIGIMEGNPLRVKEYIIKGNKITRDKTILRLSALTMVKNITPEALVQAEENILQKSYIRNCVIEPIDENSLLIKVEEGRMTFLEGVLGMNSLDGKLQYSGQFRLQFLNLWGSDRGIKLFWKQIPSANRELSLAYHESGFPGIPIAADLEIYRSEQDSTWVKSRASVEVYYQMLYQNLGVEFATDSIKPGSRRPSLIEGVNSVSYGVFWNYSHVDGRVNPAKGYELSLSYRLTSGTDDGKLRGATEAGTKTYIPITNRFVGFWGLEIRNLENSKAADWQQYKMGGYGSLRGYREDEFSSFRLAWTNYEIRYRMSPDSRMYIFFDQGFKAIDNNSIKTDLFGVGAGIKLNTKLGILGIEYGLGYRDKRFSRIGLGMVHAGLDLAF